MTFVWRTFEIVRSFVVDQLTTAPQELQDGLEAALRTDREALCAALDDVHSHLAAFAIRAWGTTMRVALVDIARVGAEQLQRIPSTIEAQVTAPGSPVRVQTLLMAATEAARQGFATSQIYPVVERAFDESGLLLMMLRRAGVVVDPFAGETREENHARLMHYLETLRSELDDDDLSVVDGARLRTLR